MLILLQDVDAERQICKLAARSRAFRVLTGPDAERTVELTSGIVAFAHKLFSYYSVMRAFGSNYFASLRLNFNLDKATCVLTNYFRTKARRKAPITWSK